MSDEVGSGHVSIFPVMTGFRGKVAKETEQAGAAGAKSFSKGFKGIGAATGRKLGTDLQSSLNASAGSLGADAVKGLNREVASAASALSRARLKQQDEAGKVRVAETKLQETIARSGAESSQAIAAEERLAAARRRSVAAADAVSAASLRLKTAQEAVAAATARLGADSARGTRGLLGMSRALRDGWKNASAAQSSFTGVAGSIGGILRATSDITGLTRLSKLVAGQVSRSFTSLATMVGGGLAKAWSSSVTWLGGVARTVRGAFAPVGQYMTSVGTLLASPFVKLGSKVGAWMSPVTSQVSALFSKISATAGPAASRLLSTFGSGISGIGGVASRAFTSVVTAASTAGAAAGRVLGQGLSTAATGAVTVAATTIGVALSKGFGRLNAIDTAQAKLRGFGHDAQTITQIMTDATASVRGTAFGLGEAATVAAAAVAAGIKPGQQLQTHLKSIANNASAAGLSMEEMGSIFNKAATQANGVQNDVIGQLADKGIPIYQELAKVLGVTAGEVFKMASEGKVAFETFSKAAQAAAGTVADEIGTTVPGAWKNMLASLGRIGANALGGLGEGSFFSKLGPLIQSVTKALGPLEERAVTLGQAWNSWAGPVMDRITGFFNSIGDGSSTLLSSLQGFMPVLAPLGGAFAALGAGGLASVLSRIGPLAALLPGLTTGLAALGGPLGIVAAAMGAFALSGGDVDGLMSGITGMVSNVVAALPGLVQQVATFVPQLVSSILAQVPALIAVGIELVGVLVDGIVSSIPILVTGALQLVQGLVQAIITNLPAIIEGAITLVTALVQGLIQALPVLVQGALQLVTGLLGAIVSALPMIIEGGVQLLMSLVQGLITALPQLVTAALDLVLGLLTAILDNLPMIIDAGIQLLMSLIDGLIAALPQLVDAAITLVLKLVVGLLDALPKLIDAGIKLVISLVTGLIGAIPKILEALPKIISAIWDGLMKVNWLDLGVQIVKGIINGLGSMVGSLVSAITDLAGKAFDGFKDFFGIKSPARKMIQPGRDVVRGAVVGVDDEAPEFGSALVDMARSASARAQAEMASVSATVSTSVVASRSGAPGTTADGAGAERSGTTVIQHNDMRGVDPRIAMRTVGREAERAFAAT